MSKARNISNLFSASTDLSTDAEVTSAISTHSSAADPHSVYLKESDFGAAGKNFVLNSNFDIAQRGTTITTNQYAYSLDRWIGFIPTTVSHQQINIQGLVPGSTYAARIQRANGSTSGNGMNFEQPFILEDINKMHGKRLTLSFYARRGANYSNSGNQLGVTLFLGTGANRPRYYSTYTNESTGFNDGIILTETYQKFTLTTNAVIPTNTTQASLFFAQYPTGTAGANDWFEITQVQLEPGTFATPYSLQNSSVSGEIAACQRYFYRVTATGGDSLFSMGSQYTTGTNFGFVQMPVTMRVAPSAAINSLANINVYYNASAYKPTAFGVYQPTNQIYGYNFTVSGPPVGAATFNTFGVSSNYLDLSAEVL
jgi:hypothetical protein